MSPFPHAPLLHPHPAAAATLLAAGAAAQTNRFLPGSVLVLRTGDGSTTYSGASSISAPVFLAEVNVDPTNPGVVGTVAQVAAVSAATGNKCTLDNL